MAHASWFEEPVGTVGSCWLFYSRTCFFSFGGPSHFLQLTPLSAVAQYTDFPEVGKPCRIRPEIIRKQGASRAIRKFLVRRASGVRLPNAKGNAA